MINTDKASLFRSRGYLPHYNLPGQALMITYRLYDSLPSVALVRFADELASITSDTKKSERCRLIEEYLDKGAGSCSLQNQSIARAVQENLLHFDGKRYIVHAWVIMPNHVHVLLTPSGDVLISDIVQSWKSYTAKRANAILGRKGFFWQREYFDRIIRNEEHFIESLAYIHDNPVKAGLCKTPGDWKFSSFYSSDR